MRIELESDDIDSISAAITAGLKDHLSAIVASLREGVDCLLTVSELAKVLKVEETQVYALVNKSKSSEVGIGIPFMKVGRLLRFSERDVLAWMRGRESKNDGSRKEVKKSERRHNKEGRQLLRVSSDRRKEEMVFGGRKLKAESASNP